jgi:predicted GTPase
MSGGSLNYFYCQLQDHVGDFGDKELDELVSDLAELFHDREWYLSADTGLGDWEEARNKFKEKWFTKHGRQKRIEKYLAEMTEEIRRDLSYMTYAPILFLSAKTGQRVDRLFELINYVNEQSALRVTTGMLNNVLADATARVQPPSDKGRRLKIYYMTQTGVKPPHFVIFCNDSRLFHFSYQRYLENQIREVFGLEGTPVRITIRQKGEQEE